MSQRIFFSKMVITILIYSFLLLIALSCNKDDDPTLPPDGETPPTPTPISNGDLPQFTLTTNGAVIVDEPKVSADLSIMKNNTVLFDGPIGIEFRGASSQGFEKKSYGFETWDTSGQDLDVSLLGFPEEEDWILNGPYSDKSLVRNHLIYDLAREMGNYASRTELVELNINDSYQGIYVFMEKLKRDKDRINISKLKIDENTGEDLTGGYILKIDKLSGSNLGQSYTSSNSFESQIPPPGNGMGQTIKYLYEYPEAEDITTEQKAYISDYVTQFENALSSDTFADPQAGYANYIDVDSFIDFFLLNELSNNVDGYRLSTYMHKDKAGKLAMGPIWDFNLAFGNADYCSGGETNVWAYKFNERCNLDFWLVPFWWERLLQDPAFVVKLKDRWNGLRGTTFSIGSIGTKIDSFVTRMQDAGAIEENFNTWSVLGVYVWPNNFVGDSYDQESNYLKTWIDDRLQWLDTAINELQ